jgi:PAS domain S-box-containing protein
VREPDSNQLVATARDVTDEKLQAAALRESEERFRLLAMHAPVGIAQSDAEGHCIFVNPKWCEIAGAKPEEALGLGWLQFLHPEDRAHVVEAWQADMAAGRLHSTSDFRFIHKDGTIRWASGTASLVLDARGKPIGQIGIAEDITDRKAAEDALRTKQSQLTGILDHAPAVIFLKDLSGRYVVVNRRHQILFGRYGASIIGKTDREFFPGPIALRFFEEDQQVLREQAPLVFEEVADHDDGPHTYRSVKFPVKDDSGRMIALGGISTDITDLKEAHEALQKQEQLLRKMLEVQENEKQFLCHEFHDGLIQYAVGSLMSLEGLRSNDYSQSASIIDEVIGNLRKGVEDGRRVIRGIRPAVLDDSNLEAALRDLIDQVPASDIMVTLDCEPGIGRLPNSVQTTVYRVVQEALNNARKHSGTDVVRIELRKLNDSLYLEIRDFGCGFDVKSSGAHGFGLLGMTERVRLLGGECSIFSEPDVGTSITVRLPIPCRTTDNDSRSAGEP